MQTRAYIKMNGVHVEAVRKAKLMFALCIIYVKYPAYVNYSTDVLS